MEQDIINAEGRGGIVIYQTSDRRTNLDVKLENDTVWLAQNQMATLFDTSKQNISLHVTKYSRKNNWKKEW